MSIIQNFDPFTPGQAVEIIPLGRTGTIYKRIYPEHEIYWVLLEREGSPNESKLIRAHRIHLRVTIPLPSRKENPVSGD